MAEQLCLDLGPAENELGRRKPHCDGYRPCYWPELLREAMRGEDPNAPPTQLCDYHRKRQGERISYED